jgi:hypothetical protein
MKDTTANAFKIILRLLGSGKATIPLAALLLLSFAGTAMAQGTVFTYQGLLSTTNAPANGSYDLTFALFNASSGGSQAGTTITNAGVSVTDGLFTVMLDFGNQFNGAPYWLEIGVRSHGSGNFTTLSPRQQLMAMPYAIMANSASNLLGTLPAAQLSGALGNSQLASNSVAILAGPGLLGGGTVALGGSTVLINAGVLSVTGNADITASTVGGGVTLGDNATSANTPSTLVKRDGNGGFAAGAISTAGAISAAGGVVVDNYGQNTNGVTPGLVFGGSGSGEGISSKRDTGGNQYGLDFYTFHQPRLSIASNGSVGIGTTNPATQLEVQGGPIKATGGLIIECRTNDPPSPITGQIWLLTQ